MCNRDKIYSYILYIGITIITYTLISWVTIDVNYEHYKGKYNMTSGCLFNNDTCNQILCYDKQYLGCLSLSLIFWFILIYICLGFYVIYVTINYNLISKKSIKETPEYEIQFSDYGSNFNTKL